jgi:hypothetical protein
VILRGEAVLIISDSKVSLGARVAVVKTDSFTASISTAKEAILRGLSTIISEGEFPNVSPRFKITYKRTVGKEKRQELHRTIARLIDDEGSNGASLEDAIVKTARFLAEEDFAEGLHVLSQ